MGIGTALAPQAMVTRSAVVSARISFFIFGFPVLVELACALHPHHPADTYLDREEWDADDKDDFVLGISLSELKLIVLIKKYLS